MIDWDKGFPAIVISRYDLKQTGLSDAEIEALDDEDMETIAEQLRHFIEDNYFDEEIWSDEEIRQHVKRSAIMRLEFGNMYGGMS